MTTVLSLVFMGFVLGMRHATDPDHVVAVSTIVTRQPSIRAALLIGTMWGVGHTLTIIVVGGSLVFFAFVIPHRLGLTLEMGVAMMLIVLGMWNLAGFLEQVRTIRRSGRVGASLDRAHSHSHGTLVHHHGGYAGSEQHAHHDDPAPMIEWLDGRLGGLGTYQLIRPLVVGLVHGLAGSAAVALLVLALIKNPWWAMVYLVVFGIGTIAGMMVITAAMGAVLAYVSSRSYPVEGLRFASGFLSVGFGLFLAYQIAIVDGLIAGTPTAAMLH
jgi:ABC-type nickel/cobalt efflux system permease component RcnA